MEEWKTIPGYEGLYVISTEGKIIKKSFVSKQNHVIKEKIIHCRKDKNGYIIATLYDKDGVRKDFKVHRLVAITFIPNPYNLPQINHKNEIKDCNYVDNLEWCTAKYNANYGSRSYRISLKQKGKPKPSSQGKNNYFYGKRFIGKDHPTSKAVNQYTKDGILVRKYECMIEAGKAVGVTPSAISLGCRGLRKTIKGYVWKYA